MNDFGKLYQDRLYGAKVLSPLAVAILDTAEFQRLSGLCQLGFTETVYRGARHSRFEHSVGTYFICLTLMRRLVQNHERLNLSHPGLELSPLLSVLPPLSGLSPDTVTAHSKWRGLTEVLSIAALIHDLGHVPFGHTFEDEFVGIYPRHDAVGGPRLYQMLFDEQSELANTFSDANPRWISGLANSELAQLIYVILNFKEETVDQANAKTFGDILESAIEDNRPEVATRVAQLKEWHSSFRQSKCFHPFMSDIVGNTICADLLDYLPRDRSNLGMEVRTHMRLHRYLTVRTGTFFDDEGLRLSIMVTRQGHGGQRHDVATEVLSVMRERYEMVERVFYHHKKAAAGTMLVKLMELCPLELRPRNDNSIYPAPWTVDQSGADPAPHITHLSDAGLIDYLGNVKVAADHVRLQRELYIALRFRRTRVYRTLLHVDTQLVSDGNRLPTYVATYMRGKSNSPDPTKRLALERQLEESVGGRPGDVLIYCPGTEMQSKEIEARMEIKPGTVLPLHSQNHFVYNGDVQVLREFYESMWRLYLFVSPDIYQNRIKCQLIVHDFCKAVDIPFSQAIHRTRGHKLLVEADTEPFRKIITAIGLVSDNLPFELHSRATFNWHDAIAEQYILALNSLASGHIGSTLQCLLEYSVVTTEAKSTASQTLRHTLRNYAANLLNESAPTRLAAYRTNSKNRTRTFQEFRDELMAFIKSGQQLDLGTHDARA